MAERLSDLAPSDLNHVLFTNSGSECADTALKLARAYWRIQGQPSKTRFIGRIKGYHGVNFAGTSLGGIGANRKLFGQLGDADHLPHTLQPEYAFTRGQAEHGEELANHLEQLILLHDASTIAAVIVEPVSGSAGVIVPPQNYLQRLRQICNEHNILLIFDEVITGFARMGATFAAQTFGVTPDILNVAKGLTNGAIPMGAVISSSVLYDAFMAVEQAEHMIELPHGYTYSAHPVACAAALAALDILQDDNMVARSNALAPVLEDSLHGLRAASTSLIFVISGWPGHCSSHRATVILLSDLLRLVCAAGKKACMSAGVAIHCNLHRPLSQRPSKFRIWPPQSPRP